MKIPFYKPHVFGNEMLNIQEAILSNKFSGDGPFTKKSSEFFENKYGFDKAFLTTSCTDALEMSAILLDIQEGDEVIMPSFTFVSTANAFFLRGANIIFADSESTSPNIDPNQIEKLITDKTKAIVVVHYAGVACDMGAIKSIALRYGNIPIVEDAAQAIDSYYDSSPLGSLGNLGTISFHETKNVISGEGGLLCVNDFHLVNRAEIIREKGTNRSSFLRGEVDKYSWCDIGSSFLPSDITAAFLYGQLENLSDIQLRRKELWEAYDIRLRPFSQKTKQFEVPFIPDFATNNGHMYYLVCPNQAFRDGLLLFLRGEGVSASFHYNSLHKSSFYADKHDGRTLTQSDKYTEQLIRLPLFHELDLTSINNICDLIQTYSS